jgi:hypothetical protein
MVSRSQDSITKQAEIHILEDLRSAGRHLRYYDGLIQIQHTLWIPASAMLAALLAGRIWPIEKLGIWIWSPLVLWGLIMLLNTILKQLSPQVVARRYDAALGLKERLSTAVELNATLQNSFPALLVQLQKQDALRATQSIAPRRAFPLRPASRPLAVSFLIALAAVALFTWPNPMDTLIAERGAVAAASRAEAEQIDELIEELQQNEQLSPDLEQLLQELASLAEELRTNPGDREQALADIARLEEALNRQRNPELLSQQDALEAIATQLKALANQQSNSETTPDSLEDALQTLAEAAAEMNPAETQELAETLAQLAAQAGQAGLSEPAGALSSLAAAAASGESDTTQAAALAAADAIEESQNQFSSDQSLANALARLEQSRLAVAAAGESAEGQSTGQGQAQGEGASQGEGVNPGQNPGSAAGGGGGGTQADSLPPAQGSGAATEPQGDDPSPGIASLDGQISVPPGFSAGNGDELFIPGQETEEGEIITQQQENPLPGTAGPALVPYQAVFSTYQEAASQTIERGLIPLGLRDYVRDYFSSLEP